MGWTETQELTSGKWLPWTQTWNTGPDLWNATNMTQYNSRYTKVGGTLYAHGSFQLSAGTNYGNGSNVWVLWWPGEFGNFVNSSTASRIVGNGVAYSTASPYRALPVQLQVVNGFSVFAWAHTVKNEGGPGQTFNGGADTQGLLDRAALSWIGAPLTFTFQLKYVTNPV